MISKEAKTYLIINRDDILYLDGLNIFLSKNHGFIDKIYFTHFFPPQADKKEYILKSLKIMGSLYLLKYMFKKVLKQLLASIPVVKNFFPKSSLPLLSKHYGIDCKRLDDINSSEFQEELIQENVQTILSITSQLYKKKIIDTPRLQIYNFHPSLLPNNKGRFPVFWAILKDENLGITCHKINEKIDDGEIIYQVEIVLNKVITVEKGMDIILKKMGDFMDKALEHIRNKKSSVHEKKQESFYGATPTEEQIYDYKMKLKHTNKSL